MKRKRTQSRQALTAAALAAMFAATGCNADGSLKNLPGSITTTTRDPNRPPFPPGPECFVQPNGREVCSQVIEGRPLRRRRRRGLLLPKGRGLRRARTEYASVASFSELSLRLIAVGAPVELVEACHRAALEEIRHARTEAGDAGAQFGAIPALIGRRIGGWARSRRSQLQRIAVESFLDGWRNESAAAAALRSRAAEPSLTDEQRADLLAMAEDEQGHAELARDIVTWCFDEDPAAVGRALAAVGPTA